MSSESVVLAKGPVRGALAPSVTTTPEKRSVGWVWHAAIPGKARISRSSAWAPIPRWVVVERLASGSWPRGA